MYQQYFGLTEQPFSIAVNPRYLFMSDRHRDALAHLLYGVGSGGGFILLTGEVGTGKTTLNRCLLEQLPEQTDIAIVLNPALSAVELLATVCDEFEVEYEQGTDSLKLLTDALHQFLLANHRASRRTVLMIDEAQHLGFEVLEQIRLLTNLETDEKKLLQIILTGQPELASMLNRPELRQLNQRITARYNLTPLNAEETAAYIQHRLRVAGLPGGRSLFSTAASKSVYRLSGGIPRLVNLLCDRALMGAYGRQEDTVSAGLVAEAATEVLGEGVSEQPQALRFGSLPKWAVVATAALLAAWFVVFLTLRHESLGLLGISPELARNDPSEVALDTAESLAPDSNVVVAERAAVNSASAAPWVLSPEDAERALWFLWRSQPLAGRLCETGEASGLICERHQTEVWDVVLDHDRPAILELRRDTGFAGAAVMLGILGDQAMLWTGVAVCNVPISTLASMWLGGFTYLWQAPAGWSGPVSEGDEGVVVTEIVRALAALDDLPVPPLSVYTPAVAERVRTFQRIQGLEIDGVMGAHTWRALSDATGRGFSLANARAVAASLSGDAQCR